MPKSSLGRDSEQEFQPGYPSKEDAGSESPEGYQKEHRAHKKSPAGTMTPIGKGHKTYKTGM